MVRVLKVYLYSSSPPKSEIRRIIATDEVLCSYRMLHQKIENLFQCLSGKQFDLSWNDEEGDKIVMSSDEELAHAVANSGLDLIKFFVHVHNENVEPSVSSQNKDTYHQYVICDACNGQVQGYRYKCLQCEDYDLCNSCNMQDKHPGHDMLKLASPSSHRRAWYFPGWRRLWESMFGHHFGRYAAGCRFSNPHHADSSQNEGGTKCFRGRGHHKSARKHNVEFVRNIGQTIADVFNPFGLDITVDVVQSDSDQEVADSNSEMEKGCTVGKENQKEDRQKESTHEEIPKPESTTKESEESPMIVEEVTVLTKDNAEGGVPSNSSSSEDVHLKSKSSLPEGASSSRESSPKPTGLFAALEHAAKAFADDWTMINSSAETEDEINNKGAKIMPETVQQNSGQSNGNAVKKEEDIPPNTDPAIAAALRNMMAMGFNNDGGWLLRLLETKKGNISEALDSLY